MVRRNVVSFFLLFLVLGAVLYFLHQKNALQVIKEISLLHWFLSVLCAIVLYVLSGIQYDIILKQKGLEFSKREIFFFPIMMNLWSLVIPVQGALLFATFYLSKIKKATLHHSASISVFIYALTMFLTGVFGLFFLITFDLADLKLYGAFVIFTVIPVLLFIIGQNRMKFGFLSQEKTKTKNRLLRFIFNLLDESLSLWTKPKVLFQVSTIKILKTLIIGIWYYIIADGLGLNVSYIVLIILGLMAELSLVFKITPDNIGINQIVSGLILSAFMFKPEWGVLISLVSSITTLFIVLSFGLFGSYLLMIDTGVGNPFSLISRVLRKDYSKQ